MTSVFLCRYGFTFSGFVQLHITEIQSHVDGDFDEVQEIKGPAQEKDPAVAAVGKQNKVLGNTEYVSDPDEDLELEGLAFGSAGLPGLVNGQRPAQAKADML